MPIKSLPIISQRAGLSPDSLNPSASRVLGECGSCSGGCSGGEQAAAANREFPEEELAARANRLEIPLAGRRLNLSAIPSTGSFVQTIDLDLTVECNLRCTYCFKEKWNEHMEETVAFDTIVWLIHASGDAKRITVNFMGGEPLLRFRLIKKLVPFAKRRAMQHGKRIHFGMTTNGTLVTNEVVAFWKKWGMGFHTSIDGTPDVQDRNRPTTGGRGSSQLVEAAVPKILSYRPSTTARSTVVPESVHDLAPAYHYFRSLGYQNIAFVPGGQHLWSLRDVQRFEEQFRRIGDELIGEMRQGRFIKIKGIDDYISGIRRSRRPSHACGAGRGLLLIDIRGDIWPCHRWNRQEHGIWRIGSIYEQFDELARQPLDRSSHLEFLEQDCDACIANVFCSGGCPAENLEHTGSVYKRHPMNCELTRVYARVGKYVYDTLLAERNQAFFDSYGFSEKA